MPRTPPSGFCNAVILPKRIAFKNFLGDFCPRELRGNFTEQSPTRCTLQHGLEMFTFRSRGTSSCASSHCPQIVVELVNVPNPLAQMALLRKCRRLNFSLACWASDSHPTTWLWLVRFLVPLVTPPEHAVQKTVLPGR